MAWIQSETDRLRHEVAELRDWNKNQKDVINELEDNAAAHKREVLDLKHQNKLTLIEKELALTEERLDVKYKPATELVQANDRITTLQIELASLKATNIMLAAAVDISGEVIDIKDLVSQLIGKLPSIDITSLNVTPVVAPVSEKK